MYANINILVWFLKQKGCNRTV